MKSITHGFVSIVLFILTYTSAFAGSIERVNISSVGVQGNNPAIYPTISADGQLVAFISGANNLVPGDTNNLADIFIHNRSTGKTERIDLSSNGEQVNDNPFFPVMSANGRVIAFTSEATNLVAGDTNNTSDVFVHDLNTGITERVNVSSAGVQVNTSTIFEDPSLSTDGRFVAFQSMAANLVTGDTNGVNDVFVHDRSTGITERVSVSSAGLQADDASAHPALSGDGRYVVFQSSARNLVIGDSNNLDDIFVHDRSTGVTERVSVSTAGLQANSGSFFPTLSADGRFVAFTSYATKLVANDTNGTADVFVHDRVTGVTERVNLSTAGAQANSYPRLQYTSLSADGRFVGFASGATNLVDDDTNALEDIFVHDRSTGVTKRVNVSANGEQANSRSRFSDVSADGRFVAFASEASNLVTADSNGFFDIFVSDRINLLGAPIVDSSSESGVYIWRTPDGRTIVRVTAGGASENGQLTDFEGNLTSGSTISNLTAISLESPDSLSQSSANIIEFDLLSQRPWEDRFSFIADESQSLCITLETYAGGLFLGPDKIEVTSPYDINGISDCGAPQIEINGTPDIDRSTETGVFAWVNQNGRTVIKFVAGDPAQNGLSTRFSGNVLASQAFNSLVLTSIESSDTVNLSQINQIDFEVFAVSPWEDRFSYITSNAQSVCITLDDYQGGLFIGPNKVEVNPPFDLSTLSACDSSPPIETEGRPVIDRSTDLGIFIWLNQAGQWASEVSSADVPRAVNIDVSSDRSLSNVTPVNVESSDVFNVTSTNISMVLNVRAPWIDGFRFMEQVDANTCLFTTNNDVPIYLGPNRVNVGNSLNLKTQASCQ